MHALLIERDAGNGLLTNDLLKFCGFSVSWLQSCELLRQCIADRKPDLVVLSARPSLPSTASVIKEIRSAETSPAVGPLPILVMSGEDPVEAAERSKRAGADAFLPIPFSSAGLLSAAIPLALATALCDRQP
jgi:DNA-binding response OmpR family regulator